MDKIREEFRDWYYDIPEQMYNEAGLLLSYKQGRKSRDEEIKKLRKIKQKTVLCAAFCGTGKTYMSKNFKDNYTEVECWKYREGDFPKNYTQDVINKLGKTKYLFISTDPIVLKALHNLDIEILLIYPKNELRNEYLDRYIDRDDPYDFIGTIMKNWNIWIDELKEQIYCKHIVLESGEYLKKTLEQEALKDIAK